MMRVAGRLGPQRCGGGGVHGWRRLVVDSRYCDGYCGSGVWLQNASDNFRIPRSFLFSPGAL